MKVLLLSRYARMGASSRVRAFQFIPYLEANGMEITVSPLFDDEYLQRLYATKKKSFGKVILAYLRRLWQCIASEKHDLVWLEKELFPYLPGLELLCLHSLGSPFVVEYDDATFHSYDLHTRTVVRALLGNKIKKIMGSAELVIAGNDYLAEYARSANARRIEILPTVVDTSKYLPKESRLPNQEFVIGWIGTPSTAKYLNLIEEALQKVSENNNVILVTVGVDCPVFSGVKVSSRQWSEQGEIEEIRKFDVGIMPLSDSPWERGKCGYKLIQYMACGVPVVASPVGVNRQIVDHGFNGFLASTSDEWVLALNTLIADRQLSTRMGEAARRKAVERYSLDFAGPRLLAMLQSVAELAIHGRNS